MASECSSPSFKDKLKFSLCCFRHHHEALRSVDDNDVVVGRYSGNEYSSKSPRSAYAWLKSTAHDLEIRDRCRGLIGMRGRCKRRYNSVDFSYDPLSYSLNFENQTGEDDELPLYNFTSRLPVTPERLPARGKWAETSAVGRISKTELVVCS